ncbi:hypothetical protein AB0P21_39300 [Kribbella sp. NPDC056861]|uniref:hypothetical protein n=1 Tax=Kribbella sp. NPDC056861 TaxID=3154857 RepID=UPI003437A9DE
MFNVFADINWLAVVMSLLVFAVLGYVYFTFIVAKPYQVALGNENREMEAGGALLTVVPLIPNLVSSSPALSSSALSMSKRSPTRSRSASSSASATSSPTP